jgi:ammonia channel protein AmtB
MALGYSLCFAQGNAFYGGPSRFWLHGVFDSKVGTVPEALFCMYQMTFAFICVAIITGSFAERMRFGPMIIFSALWHLLVYCPIAHWEWGPGAFPVHHFWRYHVLCMQVMTGPPRPERERKRERKREREREQFKEFKEF